DIAVCSADDDAGRLPYTAPSVTCLSSPAWDPYLQVCLDWFAGDHSEWQGPLLVQPDDVPVFQGESTRA
ncbi:MAG TPA: GntR family transcriptional regulator, partial [Phycisphaerae bacterium]|nr:GntR family transcriptional regulator [Phycisphaerae bacterium]